MPQEKVTKNKRKIQFGKSIIEFEEAKRGGLRWAMGSLDGPRSSTWRLWGNKKGDIYVSVRSLGGILKTSFHRDGNCHTGLTSHYAGSGDSLAPKEGSRYWDQWQLPNDPVVRALQIVVPSSELRKYKSNESAQMKWLPSSIPGSVSVVSIFIAQPGALKTRPAAEHGAKPLGIIMTNNRIVWAVYAENPIDDNGRAEIEKYRAKVTNMPGAAKVPKKPEIRAILWGSENNQDRFFIELAWDDE
jgi:hypothetical protein